MELFGKMLRENSTGAVPFPKEQYESISNSIARFASSHRGHHRLFASGWNGMLYRVRAAMQYYDEVTDSLAKSVAPPPEERHTGEITVRFPEFRCLGARLLLLRSILH